MLIRIGDRNFQIVEVFPHCVIAERCCECGNEYKVFNEKGEEEQAPFLCYQYQLEKCGGMVIFDKKAILLTSTGKFLSNKDGEKIFSNSINYDDKIEIQWNEEVTEWYDFSGKLIAGIKGIKYKKLPQSLYDKDNKTIAVTDSSNYVIKVMNSEKNIVGLSFVLSGERAFYRF